MEVIRNCSHYSFVQTSVDLDSRAAPVKIIKTTFTEEGVRSLKRERDGLTWYEKKLGVTPGVVISFDDRNDTFARLELVYKDGRLGDPGLSISKNYNKIHNALAYYMGVFRIDGGSFSHGDYSIGNILFNEDDVAWILDWEDFSDKLPRELDIVYCVVEACYFCYKRQRGLSSADIDKAIDLLKYGIKGMNMPCDNIVKAPASYARKLFFDNRPLFGRQAMKYPVVNCSDSEISALDSLFLKRIKR